MEAADLGLDGVEGLDRLKALVNDRRGTGGGQLAKSAGANTPRRSRAGSGRCPQRSDPVGFAPAA